MVTSGGVARLYVSNVTSGDAAFLLGPIGAMAAVPTAAVLIAVLRRPRWWVWFGGCLTVGVSLAWLAYWYYWGKAFDYADAYQPVPASIEASKTAAMALCAVCVVMLAAGAVVAIVKQERVTHVPSPL